MKIWRLKQVVCFLLVVLDWLGLLRTKTFVDMILRAESVPTILAREQLSS